MNEKKLEPKSWWEKNYSRLYNELGDSEFRISDALNVLKKSLDNKINKDDVSAVLSELRKVGRLETKLDPEDNRKRIYSLIGPEKILSTNFEKSDKKLTRSELEGILKKAADIIRTRVDYEFILILLFLKRVSDKWKQEYNEQYDKAINDGLSREDAEKEAQNEIYHDFDLPKEYLWDNIRKDTSTLPQKFSKALKVFAERNPELKDVIDNVDFINFTSSRENVEILRQLVELFSKKSLHNVSEDILGDAYEWILRYFAPQKAKEGEVYTPREVIRLIVEILKPKSKQSIYDPASGSNGMLIISYDYLREKQGKEKADRLFLYGQEHKQKTRTLGTMNLYIHGIINTNIEKGDTLIYPKFKTSHGVKQFDLVIANPPWNLKGYGEEQLKRGEFWKDRFKYGFTTKQSADWAWIQHMLASANENGRIGVIIDNGCLFRSGREKKIRKKILNEDLLESIILLPEKLFYNTGAPGAIMIFNKKKESSRKNKILFINASEEYEKHPDVRKLNILSEGNIKNIKQAYDEFDENDGFSRAVPLDEIKENDYNLNVTLYVFTEEEIEDINIQKEWKDLNKIEDELSDIKNKIKGYLEEIEG